MEIRLDSTEQGVLLAIARARRQLVRGVHTLVRSTLGIAPSENAEIVAIREVSCAAEILMLRGLVQIDRRRTAGAVFRLTPQGRILARQLQAPRTRTRLRRAAAGGILAVSAAVSGCAALMADQQEQVPPQVQPRFPRAIVQIVDEFRGRAFFGVCVEDCPVPTPKTPPSAGPAVAAAVAAAPAAADAAQRAAPEPPREIDKPDAGPAPVTPAPAARNEVAATREHYTTFFGFASSDLDPLVRDALRAMGSRSGEQARVRIVGRTDPTGPYDVNRALAQQRAKSAARELVIGGMKWSQIEILAEPATAPSLDGVESLGGVRKPAGHAQARRADIELARPAASIAKAP